MANWWDAAPIANKQTSVTTDANWWEEAPVAQDDNTPLIPPMPANGSGGGGSGNGGSPTGGKRQGTGDSLAGFAGQIRNGLTFGFGDELSAGVATPLNMAVNAIRGREVGSIGDNYNALVDADRNIASDFSEENPLITAGSQIAGGIASGGALAKAAPTVFGLGTRGGQIAQGAKAGLTQGALFGAGSAEGDLGDRAMGAAQGGAIGAAGGAVLTPLANAAGGLVRGLSGKAPAVGKSADDIRQEASNLYKAAAQQGGTLKSSVTDKFVNQAKSLLPQTDEGRLILGENDVSRLVSRIADAEKGLGGKSLSLGAAQEIDEGLSSMISNNTDAVTGKVTKEGSQLRQLQNSLRDSIKNASEADIDGGKAGFDSWNQARGTWFKSIKASEIERIIERANMTDNPASALKTGFKNYVTRKENLNGLNKKQVDALKRAATTGIATDAFRIFGSRLIPYAAGAAGTGVGGPVGAAVGAAGGYVGSTASRAAATGLQNARASNALNMITAGNRLPTASENLGQRARSVFGLQSSAPNIPSNPQGAIGGGAATVNQSIQPQSQPAPTIQRSPNANRLSSRPEVSAIIGGGTLPVLAGTGGIASMLGAQSSNGGGEPPRMPSIPPNPAVQNPQEFDHDDFLNTLTNGVESNGELNAKNPKSSALGPYQIIRSTFAGLVKKYDPETYKKGDFQKLRSDPEYSRFIAKKYSEENLNKLVSEGLPINKTTAYLAWFADGRTAAKLLKSPANAPASSVFSDAALEANPFLKGKNVGQVVQWAQKKVNRA